MSVYSHTLPIHRMLLRSVNSAGCTHSTNDYNNVLCVLHFPECDHRSDLLLASLLKRRIWFVCFSQATL